MASACPSASNPVKSCNASVSTCHRLRALCCQTSSRKSSGLGREENCQVRRERATLLGQNDTPRAPGLVGLPLRVPDQEIKERKPGLSSPRPSSPRQCFSSSCHHLHRSRSPAPLLRPLPPTWPRPEGHFHLDNQGHYQLAPPLPSRPQTLLSLSTFPYCHFQASKFTRTTPSGATARACSDLELETHTSWTNACGALPRPRLSILSPPSPSRTEPPHQLRR